MVALLVGCGARSGLDPRRLQPDANAGGPSSGGAAGSRSPVGGASAGGASGGTASGGFAAGGLATAGAPAPTGGVAAGGEGGVAGSADAGAAGDDGSGGEPGTPRVVEVVGGAFHSCARFHDGSLRCFGSAFHSGLALGKLVAIGDDEPASSASDVSIGGNVRALSASWYHTCAVLDGGRLRCFGNGVNGYLGYGNGQDIGDDEIPTAAGDVPVGGVVRQVATGPDHTCAVLEGGSVRCWGKNQRYQLGYPSVATIGDDEQPASVPFVDVGGPVKQVACGFAHTCALLESGKVRCWGTGNGGQLGYGGDEVIGDDEAPGSAGDLDLGGTATQITAGMAHTCALLESGNVRCWGRGHDGVLGYGNLDHVGDDETPANAGDVDVGGVAIQVEAGDHATCALLSTGAVRCWGDGQHGQLGQLSTEMIGDDEAPATVPAILVGASVTQLSVGFYHVCATTSAGAARCWGRGATGALGYGSPQDVGDDESPAAVGDVPLR